MRPQHLVHKLTNRRMGVEYAVSGFEVKGSKDLPEPNPYAPGPAESINFVQEYRPVFTPDVQDDSVRTFLGVVVQDVQEAWDGLKDSEPIDQGRVNSMMSRSSQISEAVNVYWQRLCKRYEEQVTKMKGGVGREEVTRRKQNQYRRQQSVYSHGIR